MHKPGARHNWRRPADPPGFGVGIAAEAECALTANVVENAPLCGMFQPR